MIVEPDNGGGGGGGGAINIVPADLVSVAGKFASGQVQIDSIATALLSALDGCAGMAGDDNYGHTFAQKYDPAAKALFRAFSATVRAVGQATTGLIMTVNNYLKADHHSDATSAGGEPDKYPMPPVIGDVVYPDPASAVGSGHTSVPSFLAKYWPNGHPDRLRQAAQAYRTASQALGQLGQSLHQEVTTLTDFNSSESMEAMAKFWAGIWQGDPGAKAPMSAGKSACDKLASACDAYAAAIDRAHSKFKALAAGAGIAIGLTSALGGLLTLFTGGGSDVAAGAADAAEAAAIFGGVETVVDEAVSSIAVDMIADLEILLQDAADGVPEIESVEAETTEVNSVLERELEADARQPAGVRGGGRGGTPTGGDGTPGTGDFPEDGDASPRIEQPELDDIGERYVRDKHFPGGDLNTSDKSTFLEGEDPYALAQRAQGRPATGPNPQGNYERIVDAGRPVGHLSKDAGGSLTSRYVVVQDKWGGIVTMYPIR